MSALSPEPPTGRSTYRPPTELPAALFEVTENGVGDGGDLVTASELTRGPWAHRVMHGGPICGVLGWAVETALGRSDLVCTRLTVDILSGVEVDELTVTRTVHKAGSRTALVDASLVQGGRVVARASSQWLLGTPSADGPVEGLPPIPGDRQDPAAHGDFEYPRPGFNADAVDLRVLEGSTEDAGPGRIWMRLDHRLVAGEDPTPFQQVATLSDLGAAVGWEPSPSGASLINTDVTLQLLRVPRGPWFLFESHIDHGDDGIACCRSVISDGLGVLGWVLQSQVEAPAAISF
jgi:acyl-coenzyme A thioesterase PaaI-like protein